MVFVDRINKGTLCQVQRQEEKELGMVQELKEVDMKCGERRRGEVIDINVYSKKKERSQIKNLTSHLK